MCGTLSQLSYLLDLDKQKPKGVGDALTSLIGETAVIGKEGSHYVILLYCETLL